MRTGLPEVHTYQSTRNVCSSSTRMPEAPAEDGECRRTSSAIDSFVLRFLAPGVRRTPPGGLQPQREGHPTYEARSLCAQTLRQGLVHA